ARSTTLASEEATPDAARGLRSALSRARRRGPDRPSTPLHGAAQTWTSSGTDLPAVRDQGPAAPVPVAGKQILGIDGALAFEEVRELRIAREQLITTRVAMIREEVAA